MRVEFTCNDRNEPTETRRYDAATGGTKVSSTDFGYDDGGRLTSEVHKDGAGIALVTYANAYDAANRITSETRNGTPKNFTYDVNSQVTSDGTGNYTFDANGNRNMAGYTTGAANRYSSDGTWNYTHDAEGNQTKKVRIADGRTWTYGYDHRNQMKWAEERQTDGGALLQRIDYGYDVYGNLVREVVGGVTTKHAYRITNTGYGFTKSVHETWADLDGANNLTLRYVHGDGEGEILARITSAGIETWFGQDRLNSLRELLDASGVLVKHLNYDGYGNIILETGGADKGLFLFAGYRLDVVTGDLVAHWRRYDPKTGQWKTEDPIGIKARDANFRRYAGNNGTNATDLTGLDDRTIIEYPIYLKVGCLKQDWIGKMKTPALVNREVDDVEWGIFQNVWEYDFLTASADQFMERLVEHIGTIEQKLNKTSWGKSFKIEVKLKVLVLEGHLNAGLFGGGGERVSANEPSRSSNLLNKKQEEIFSKLVAENATVFWVSCNSSRNSLSLRQIAQLLSGRGGFVLGFRDSCIGELSFPLAASWSKDELYPTAVRIRPGATKDQISALFKRIEVGKKITYDKDVLLDKRFLNGVVHLELTNGDPIPIDVVELLEIRRGKVLDLHKLLQESNPK